MDWEKVMETSDLRHRLHLLTPSQGQIQPVRLGGWFQ